MATNPAQQSARDTTKATAKQKPMTAEEIGKKDGTDLYTVLRTHEQTYQRIAANRSTLLKTTELLESWLLGFKHGIIAAGYQEAYAKKQTSEMKTIITAYQLKKPVEIVVASKDANGNEVNVKVNADKAMLDSKQNYAPLLETARKMVRVAIPSKRGGGATNKGPRKYDADKFKEQKGEMHNRMEPYQTLDLINFAVTEFTRYYSDIPELKADLTAIQADVAGLMTSFTKWGNDKADEFKQKTQVQKLKNLPGVNPTDAAIEVARQANAETERKAKESAEKQPTPAVTEEVSPEVQATLDALENVQLLDADGNIIESEQEVAAA